MAYKKSYKKKTSKKRASPEHDLQKAFFTWLSLQFPQVRKVTFAIPNGAKRSLEYGAYMRAEGLTSGIPDCMIAVPHGTFSGFFIEFKIKPNKPTPEQEAMIANLITNGYRAEVCYSLEEAIDMVTEYVES